MVQVLLTHFEDYDRRIFWSLSASILVLLGFYITFLGVSVFAVVERKHAEAQADTLNAGVAQLESQYAVLDRHINLAMAHNRGFVDIAVPTYLYRDKPEIALSLRSETSPSR